MGARRGLGSTEGLGINVERLPRSPLDEVARAAMVGERVEELLRSYDAVVHSDVDELVLADPGLHRDLVAFATDVGAPVVTAAGLDLQHVPDSEPPLDLERSVGEQRRWVRFSAAMCKPAFVRRRVAWDPGFHGSDAPTVFGGLYLIHLRYADLAIGLRRLSRTRRQAFARPETNLHQRVPDAEFAGMMGNIAKLPPEPFVLDVQLLPLAGWLERVRAGRERGEPVLTLAGDRLWELPERVRRIF